MGRAGPAQRALPVRPSWGAGVAGCCWWACSMSRTGRLAPATPAALAGELSCVPVLGVLCPGPAGPRHKRRHQGMLAPCTARLRGRLPLASTRHERRTRAPGRQQRRQAALPATLQLWRARWPLCGHALVVARRQIQHGQGLLKLEPAPAMLKILTGHKRGNSHSVASLHATFAEWLAVLPAAAVNPACSDHALVMRACSCVRQGR